MKGTSTQPFLFQRSPGRCKGSTAGMPNTSRSSTLNGAASMNSGKTWANIHQNVSVCPRLMSHDPRFHTNARMVGASSRATPQYQECVGRFWYV